MNFNILNISRVVSITINILEKDKAEYYALLLKYSNKEVEIVKEYNPVKSLDDLIENIGRKIPVLLHFTGKGIINKKVINSGANNLHQSVILNGKVDDFYFTDFTNDNQVFSSFIRKSVANEIVSKFNEEKIDVIQVSNGPFLLSFIQPFLNKQEFKTNNYSLFYDNNQLVSYNRLTNTKTEKYKIGDKYIANNYLNALSNGSLYFSENNSTFDLSTYSNVSEIGLEDATQKSLFYKFRIFLLLFFLILLFANYMYLGHLNNRFQENSILLSEYVETFDQIKSLEEEKYRKESLLRTSGVLSKKNISFYLVKLSNSVPKDISFNEINVKPLKFDIKQKKKVEIENQLIYISGTSKSSNKLSDWIDDLKEFEWINKIDILDYDQEKGVGNFNLKIII